MQASWLASVVPSNRFAIVELRRNEIQLQRQAAGIASRYHGR
jgi:hypothetical protein